MKSITCGKEVLFEETKVKTFSDFKKIMSLYTEKEHRIQIG